MTVRQALNEIKSCLRASGREDAERIAMLLMEEATGFDFTSLVGAMDGELTPGAAARLSPMAERAARGEPLQYILGYWDFYGRRFRTDPRALIPRPETELLAEAVIAAVPGDGEALRVMDAGCGTGCIGITISLERPGAQITLCDVSPGALALARENAALLSADVQVMEADMRAPFPGGPYDVIVSNPPYIDATDMAALPESVARYEPELALYGGVDGLDFIRALSKRAQDSLRQGGRMFIEVGYNQAAQAVAILGAAGMQAAARPDYAGIPRVIEARKGY